MTCDLLFPPADPSVLLAGRSSPSLRQRPAKSRPHDKKARPAPRIAAGTVIAVYENFATPQEDASSSRPSPEKYKELIDEIARLRKLVDRRARERRASACSK